MKIKINNKIEWSKVIGSGIVLGYIISMLYLMLVLTANITA